MKEYKIKFTKVYHENVLKSCRVVFVRLYKMAIEDGHGFTFLLTDMLPELKSLNSTINTQCIIKIKMTIIYKDLFIASVVLSILHKLCLSYTTIL